MKVLLLYPRFPDTFWSFRHALPFIGKRSSFPPLGLLTVSAMLPPHWKRKLVDVNVEKLRDRDLAWADVAFLSAMLVQGPSLEQLIARCRKAGLRTVVGGPVTSAENPSYADADHVFRGEAETLIEELVSDLETGKARRFYEASGRADITRVPPPDFHLARMGRYSSMPVQYSRGCPFNCEFCDVIELFGRVPRTKTTHQVLQEFEHLYRSGWRGSVFVVDDNFVGNKNVLKGLLPRITDWMASRGNPFYLFTQASINLAEDDELLSLMHAARFDKVFVGIETPSVECNRAAGKMQNVKADLLECVKRIQKSGMEVMGGFIVGFDQDTPDTFQRQIDFIREAAIPISMVGLLTALPNTQLWRRLSEEGRILRQSMGDNTDILLNYMPKMNPEALLAGYRKVLSSIYSPSEYFERTLVLLSRLGSRPRTRRVFSDYVGLLRSFVRQGIIARYRVAYWRFIAQALRHAPKHLGLAVTLAIMGHHFFTLARRLESKPSR
ncbi:MAG: B12-binding domain-containing radical SAM protein [Deltaproteobacteria bacterium]|nr:B12-binding domain-containing radical SAM protein [Deltaproteobacteria bacterium]